MPRRADCPRAPRLRRPAPVRRALVLVGRGRYEDPWHDGAATAGVLQPLLADDGWDVRVHGTFPDLLAEDGLVAATLGRPDLVVVAAGNGRSDADFDGTDEDWAGFHAALAGLVRDGVPLLALHASANAFHDAPGWSRTIGGRWVDGTSWHPPIGTARFDVADGEHPVTAGLAGVEAFDERYCDLVVDPGARVLLTTRHEGRDHPVVWVAPGPGRVLYDALGHDVRSWQSPSRRALVRREVAWLASGAA
ncbi:ThuA domain-containing protein [Cellulomonas sp. JZ18]|uniref:ThuA domain-containing protein n=1 Tax=Cellulomonas sp. JZ18 TaxID=2654191 RepID=UPI002105A6FA|nr:ThuA domain-containing protein [Cellulomonas sp. JZ18]